MRQESGSYFDVHVYDDEGYVRKYPKKECVKGRMQWIAETQTRLAEIIKGIMPATYHGDYIEMRIAPGVQCKKIEKRKFRAHVKPMIEEIVRQVEAHGCKLTDLGRTNVFYDETEDQVWIIDYSHLTT